MKSLKYIIATLSIILMVVLFNIDPSLSKDSKEIWQLHNQDQPIPTPLVSVDPKTKVKDELVIYGQSDNQSLIGYLAYPETDNKAIPAVILIHEWWGLNDNIKSITRRLAGEGYLALAVDLYKGSVADTPERARELVTIANNNKADLEDNLKQAYQYLSTAKKAPKIASLGWCFGGTWSLNTALLLPDQLNAAIIYYGGGITTDKELLQTLEMPILGIFGELDTNPNLDTVKEFEANLQELDKTADIHIYPNADHAFSNPSGTRYNAEAAEDAWSKTLKFLSTHLAES